MNNKFQEMMEAMMETMMAEMMQKTMEKMMSQMMGTPEVANAEAVDTPPAKQEKAFRVSAADILAESKNVPTKAQEPSEFGFWRATNRDGESRTWCGWANPNNGEANFPGHKLYRINDFYIKKFGGKHSCYAVNGEIRHSAKYDMRNDRRALMANYQVRNVVAKADREAFMEYMKSASDKARAAMDDSWFEQ